MTKIVRRKKGKAPAKRKIKKAVARSGLSPAQYETARRQRLMVVCSAPLVDAQFIQIESTINGRTEHVYLFNPNAIRPADTTPQVQCRLCPRIDPRHNVVGIREEMISGRVVETGICESCAIHPTERELILEKETERAIRLKAPIRWSRVPDKTPGEWGKSPLRIFHERCMDRQPVEATRRLQAEERQSDAENERGGSADNGIK